MDGSSNRIRIGRRTKFLVNGKWEERAWEPTEQEQQEQPQPTQTGDEAPKGVETEQGRAGNASLRLGLHNLKQDHNPGTAQIETEGTLQEVDIPVGEGESDWMDSLSGEGEPEDEGPFEYSYSYTGEDPLEQDKQCKPRQHVLRDEGGNTVERALVRYGQGDCNTPTLPGWTRGNDKILAPMATGGIGPCEAAGGPRCQCCARWAGEKRKVNAMLESALFAQGYLPEGIERHESYDKRPRQSNRTARAAGNGVRRFPTRYRRAQNAGNVAGNRSHQRRVPYGQSVQNDRNYSRPKPAYMGVRKYNTRGYVPKRG